MKTWDAIVLSGLAQTITHNQDFEGEGLMWSFQNTL